MFDVPPPAPEIRLLWRDGSVLRFSSVLSAAVFAQAHGLLRPFGKPAVGEHFGPWVRSFRFPPDGGWNCEWEPKAPHVVCCTGPGDPVPVDDLLSALGLRRPLRFAWYEQRPEDYRKGPVPGVHKRNGYGWFRYPKTCAERRRQAAAEDDLREYGMTLQQAGRVRNLVSERDDISRHAERSWKRHRRHQARRR